MLLEVEIGSHNSDVIIDANSAPVQGVTIHVKQQDSNYLFKMMQDIVIVDHSSLANGLLALLSHYTLKGLTDEEYIMFASLRTRLMVEIGSVLNLNAVQRYDQSVTLRLPKNELGFWINLKVNY